MEKIHARQTLCHSWSLSTIPTLLGLVFLSFTVMPAQAESDSSQDALVEPKAMEVDSPARKPQSQSEAPAAVFVVSREDIRRSGMTTIPELLRLVPGLNVAQINNNKWAITSRGFNGRWADKLLVLMDGRTLNSPLFSGVYWDAQNTAIEDIERIEVIRGAGGALWGSGAVNGVVNIITRHSRDTQGRLLVARVGDQDTGATFRYGGSFADSGWMRAYAKVDDSDAFVDAGGNTTYDSRLVQQAGFRADWEPTARDELTLQGDTYSGGSEQTTTYLQNVNSAAQLRQDNADLDGINLMLHWRRHLDERSDWAFQTYFDRADRNDLILNQRVSTLDLDFQHRFPWRELQEITWGLGYRRVEENIKGSFSLSFEPPNRNQDLISAFVEDEILLRDDLRLSMGARFEHNDYSGDEYQPSIHLLWLEPGDRIVWGAVSQAIRIPSRSDTDMRSNYLALSSPSVDPDGPSGPLVAGDPTLFSTLGNKNLDAEDLLSFELGYRNQPRPDLSYDVTAFYNVYNHLLSSERSVGSEGTPVPTNAVIADTADNKLEGRSYGLELASKWQAKADWRLFASYSWLNIDMGLDAGSNNFSREHELEQASPEQQIQLRSQWDLRNDLELDMALYYVDSIVVRDSTGFVHIPDYSRFDVRVAWQAQKDLELSVVGQNLLDDQHPEFLTTDGPSSEVPRALYGQIKLILE